MNDSHDIAHRRIAQYFTLEIGGQDSGSPSRIDFEAPDSMAALATVERKYRGLEAELFESGRSIATCGTSGYWVVSPAPD